MKKEVPWFPPPGRRVTQLLALFLLALSVDLAAATHVGKLKYCTFLLVRFALYCAREHFRRAVEQVDTNWVLDVYDSTLPSICYMVFIPALTQP